MIGERSFKKDIDESDLFLSEQHREALARLEFIVKSRGLGLIVGEPGAGKSTLLRAFVKRLDPSKYCVCYINNSELHPKDLYSDVLIALAVNPYSYLSKIKRQFNEVVTELYKSHQRQLVVLIDNAHTLPVPTIHEIRYMISFEMDSKSPMSIILVGQSELWATLRLRTFEPVFYRFSSIYQLRGLNQKQTKEYIMHQLKLSGLTMVFPDDVIAKIWSHAKGLPQIINTLCIHCLIDMEANSLDLVDNQVLERVLKELQI